MFKSKCATNLPFHNPLQKLHSLHPVEGNKVMISCSLKNSPIYLFHVHGSKIKMTCDQQR